MRGDWAANILVVDITEELESCLKAIISCECRTPDFQCLPACQIIEENWIISIFVKSVDCLFGRLLQHWGIRDVQGVQYFSRDGQAKVSIEFHW